MIKNYLNSKFYFRNMKSNSCLIEDHGIVNVYGQQNQRHLKHDLLGLPLRVGYNLQYLSNQNCCLLGLTMLNCCDPITNKLFWSYHHVDLSKRCKRIQSTKSLRRGLIKIKLEEAVTRGHGSTMKFCRNDADAKASCSQENIVFQSTRQNNVCCKTWEDTIENRMEQEHFIAHITTVVDHKRNNKHSMYKVLFEEHYDHIDFSCYLMYDAHDESEMDIPYKEIKVDLDEIERKTRLDFLNSYTLLQLGRSYSNL